MLSIILPSSKMEESLRFLIYSKRKKKKKQKKVLDIFQQFTFVIKQTKTTYKSNYKQ